MPFTFAHPAIILPLRKLPKHWFSLTGLIIGAITPDFEYFIRMRVKSIYSHTLPGLFWFDLPLGLLLTFVYLEFIRDGLITHLPVQLNRRFSKYYYISLTKTLLYIALTALSVLIGAASHLLWDGFTHPGGYFVQFMPMLSTVVHVGSHNVYVYNLLQHSSTLAGFVFIAYVICKMPIGNPTRVIPKSSYWLTILISIILTIIARFLTGLPLEAYGNLIVTGISGALIGLVINAFCFLIVKEN